MSSDRNPQKADRLPGEADRPVQVILFSSYARGDADDAPDANFLAIESEVGDPDAEMVRMSRLLPFLGVAADASVSMMEVEKRRGGGSGAAYRKMREDKVLYATT